MQTSRIYWIRDKKCYNKWLNIKSKKKERNMYNLGFIAEQDFEKQVLETINSYKKALKSIDLKHFNNNTIDPIKLVFDRHILSLQYEKIIELEIQRQRDKSNSNAIGYFHQNMFSYIKNCEVPKEGWDVIFRGQDVTYYVEMKNKHNTMNSSSSAKTFIKMQQQLLVDGNCVCALVEVIAKESQDIPWQITIDKVKQPLVENLRRISIDKFYEIVTGDAEAFSKICKQLPITVKKILEKESKFKIEKDTVLEELSLVDKDLEKALFKIAFQTYSGFGKKF